MKKRGGGKNLTLDIFFSLVLIECIVCPPDSLLSQLTLLRWVGGWKDQNCFARGPVWVEPPVLPGCQCQVDDKDDAEEDSFKKE